MQNVPFLSVVIPSYNEQSNLKKGVLEHVYEYLTSRTYTWEMVLTDDGSTDGTTEALKAFAKGKKQVTVIENDHRGKGPTVYAGMMAATGENRLFTDLDQATPIEEVEKLIPFVEKKYDVVIGSREVEGSRREREPFYRHIMGKGFNMLVTLIAIRGIHDTQCGFKLFTKDAVQELFPHLSIYKLDGKRTDAFTGAFDVELLYIARS